MHRNGRLTGIMHVACIRKDAWRLERGSAESGDPFCCRNILQERVKLGHIINKNKK